MSQVTVTDSATLMVAANSARQSLILANAGTVTVFLGPSSSVTSADGVPMVANGTFQEDSGGERLYQGAIYGVTASGTSDVRVWERTR